MEREFHTPKWWIVIAAAFVLIAMALGYGFIRSAIDGLYEEKANYLEEISTQSASLVREQINGYFSTLEALATVLAADEELEVENMLAVLRREVEKGFFIRMGVIMQDGAAFTTDGYSQSLDTREYFKEAFAGHNATSNVLKDAFGEDFVNAFAVPVYQKGKVQCAIFATKTQDSFSDYLEMENFHGKSYSCIITGEGVPVIQAAGTASIGQYNSYFTFLEQSGVTEQQISLVKQHMLKQENGTIDYKHGQTEWQISYAPVGINDWYIFCMIPAVLISAQSNQLVNNLVLMMMTTTLLGIVIGSLFLRIAHTNNKRLRYLAYHDTLTTLPNWEGFRVEAQRILHSGSYKPYAMITFDINKFKLINDLFGYQHGNEILCKVGQTLRGALSEDECCCHTAADLFYLLLRYEDEQGLVQRLKEIECSIEDMIDHYKIKLTMGICTIDVFESDVSVYCDKANLSRTIAKKKNTCSYHFFKEENRLELLREKEIENVMDAALKQEEFLVYLQPKYSAQSSEMVGAEALVRWNRPNEGLIAPVHFIPLFEKNGFIRKLDLFMFESVCHWFEAQMKQDPQKVLLPISVNISRAHLSDARLPENLDCIAKAHGVPPSLIEIELTESTIFENMEEAVPLMEQLREYGFVLSIDDFGSGYSSLASLKSLPVDVVKLDKSFLDEAESDERGKFIISGMVKMMKSLNMLTVAEGVETSLQLEMLKKVGCDIVQGYFYARPMPIADYENLTK